MIGKSLSLVLRRPMFEYLFQVIFSWASHITFLSLHFLPSRADNKSPPSYLWPLGIDVFWN